MSVTISVAQRITAEDLTECGPHRYSTFASDLNWPISMADWPETVETALGNGQPFYAVEFGQGVIRYRQPTSCLSLRIFNT